MLGWLAGFNAAEGTMVRVRPARPATHGLAGPTREAPAWDAVLSAMRLEVEASDFERQYAELAEEPAVAGVGTG